MTPTPPKVASYCRQSLRNGKLSPLHRSAANPTTTAAANEAAGPTWLDGAAPGTVEVEAALPEAVVAVD
jgi:hypothetical protein